MLYTTLIPDWEDRHKNLTNKHIKFRYWKNHLTEIQQRCIEIFNNRRNVYFLLIICCLKHRASARKNGKILTCKKEEKDTSTYWKAYIRLHIWPFQNHLTNTKGNASEAVYIPLKTVKMPTLVAQHWILKAQIIIGTMQEWMVWILFLDIRRDLVISLWNLVFPVTVLCTWTSLICRKCCIPRYL